MASAKKSKKRKIVLASLLLVVSLPILVVAIVVLRSGMLQDEREAWPRYQRVEASGTPLNLPGFKKSFEARREENAALELFPRLERLQKSRQALSPEESKVLNAALPWSSNDKVSAEAVAALDKLRPEFDAATRAIGKPRFVVDHDWSQTINIAFTEYGLLRTYAKLAALQAVYSAQRNRQEALKLLTKLDWVARYAGDTPILIGSYVETGLLVTAQNALRHCIEVDPGFAPTYAAVFDAE